MEKSLESAIEDLKRHAESSGGYSEESSTLFDDVDEEGKALAEIIDPAFGDTYDAEAAPGIIAAANKILADGAPSAEFRRAYVVALSLVLQLKTEAMIEKFPALKRREELSDLVSNAFQPLLFDLAIMLTPRSRLPLPLPIAKKVFAAMQPFKASQELLSCLMLWAAAEEDFPMLLSVFGMCEDLETFSYALEAVNEAIWDARNAEGEDASEAGGIGDVPDFFKDYPALNYIGEPEKEESDEGDEGYDDGDEDDESDGDETPKEKEKTKNKPVEEKKKKEKPAAEKKKSASVEKKKEKPTAEKKKKNVPVEEKKKKQTRPTFIDLISDDEDEKKEEKAKKKRSSADEVAAPAWKRVKKY